MNLVSFFLSLWRWTFTFGLFGIGQGGGFFGSGASSSASTSTVTTETQNIDRRVVNEGSGAVISGDVGGNVTLTDQGAVAGAFGAATEALRSNAVATGHLASALTSIGETNAQAQVAAARDLNSTIATVADTSERARLQGFQSLLDAGKTTLRDAESSFKSLLDLTQSSNETAYRTLNQQVGIVGDVLSKAAATPASSQAEVIKYLVIGLAAIAGLFAYRTVFGKA